MKIRVSITIDEEEPIDLLSTERSELQAGNLGFSLAETKLLLANGQKTLVDAQAAMHARTRQCEICGEPLRRKGRGTIVARTLFGKIPVDSPRFYRCACSVVNASSGASFSPLAELLPERTLPELQYLQVKWAASMSYGLTLEILRDVFPIGDALGKEAIRNNVVRVARRLDAELGDEPAAVQNEIIVEAPPPTITVPLMVGIDGGYVRGRAGKGRKDGCFEVIVGKSVPAEGDAKCFGFVQRIEEKPKRRLRDVLDAQGFQEHQPIIFLSDGADTVRNLQRDMSPSAEHILDWFHITMRITVMSNSIAGLEKGRMRKACSKLSDLLERVKWNVWHGKVDRALERAEELRSKLVTPFTATARAKIRKLRAKLVEFIGYIDANRAFIPSYEKRYHAGQPITTSFAESAVDQIISHRFAKRQQMRWTDQGCHNVLQIRTRVINDELHSAVQCWHPTLQMAA
jgi:hypothetical protein